MDDTELQLLSETLGKSIASATGRDLHRALIELGWHDMLSEMPETAIPLVFRLLGEHGAHAPVLNDVVRRDAGLLSAERRTLDPPPLRYTGGSWVVWDADSEPDPNVLDPELPLRAVEFEGLPPTGAGRRALGWWLTGTARAMLALARTHALDRMQFGRPLASFQAVRHRLAETLVTIEGAEAALSAADELASATGCPATPAGDSAAVEADFSASLAKAAAGQAALTAARHCQQVLGGIGFTAEHDLHRHIRRALVLDGLLGSSRELTRAAGARLRAGHRAPRLINL